MQMLLPFGVFLGLGAIAALLFGSPSSSGTQDSSGDHYSQLVSNPDLTMLTGLFLLAVLFAVLLYAAHTRNSRRSWSNHARLVHRDPDRQHAWHSVSVALAAASVSPACR